MTTADDNVTLALRLAGPDPADWLARADRAVHGTFGSFLTLHRFDEATAFLLEHIRKTEHTRAKVHGPAPTWDEALDIFAAAVDRQQPAQLATVLRLVVERPRIDESGELADVVRLPAGEECGLVRADQWVCIRRPHPGEPGAHYCVAVGGSS